MYIYSYSYMLYFSLFLSLCINIYIYMYIYQFSKIGFACFSKRMKTKSKGKPYIQNVAMNLIEILNIIIYIIKQT